MEYGFQVVQPYFDLIKEGKKVIELRLYDELRQKLKVGDFIIFSTDDNDIKIRTQITGFERAPNFRSLCDIIDISQAGFSTVDELLSSLSVFYSKERETNYGVVGIRIKLL